MVYNKKKPKTMIFNRNKSARNNAASGTAKKADPEGVKKFVCMGPTMFGNYRVIACLYNEKEVHYYMDGKGNLYIPPKHTKETLINEVAARREWNWAKENWDENNVPFLLFGDDKKQLRNNAFKALAQVRSSRNASSVVQSINAKTQKATLADVPGLMDGLKDLKSAPKKITNQAVKAAKATSPKEVVLKKVEPTSNPVVSTEEEKPNYGECRIEKFNKKYSKFGKTSNG
jgi:hypothetical protein